MTKKLNWWVNKFAHNDASVDANVQDSKNYYWVCKLALFVDIQLGTAAASERFMHFANFSQNVKSFMQKYEGR